MMGLYCTIWFEGPSGRFVKVVVRLLLRARKIEEGRGKEFLILACRHRQKWKPRSEFLLVNRTWKIWHGKEFRLTSRGSWPSAFLVAFRLLFDIILLLQIMWTIRLTWICSNCLWCPVFQTIWTATTLVRFICCLSNPNRSHFLND